MACACMSSACTSPPVWLGTTELAYFKFQVNLTPGLGQHPSRWLRQAGWLAAGLPISLSYAGPARCAMSVSIQLQPATFLAADCSSIGPECASTSALPRLASQKTSASQRAMPAQTLLAQAAAGRRLELLHLPPALLGNIINIVI